MSPRPPTHAARLSLILLALVPACSRQTQARALPGPPSKEELIQWLERSGISRDLYHDYGTIDLGTQKSHDFLIPIPELDGADWIAAPESFAGDCSCAIGTVRIVDAEGNRRVAYGLPPSQRRLREGDKVILTIVLDTRDKEPVDVPRTLSYGRLAFQHMTGQYSKSTTRRLAFHYGIRTPIKLSPKAHLKFGEVPLSLATTHRLRLSNNIPGSRYKLGVVSCAEPSIQGTLRKDGDEHILDVKIDPQEPQPRNLRTTLLIGTDIPDLPTLRIPVSGSFVPDVVIQGPSILSWGFHDFGEERTDKLNIVDHNHQRARGFVLHSVVETGSGKDLSEHFELDWTELSGRTMRMHLKYLGTLGGKVLRARLRLAKAKGGPVVCEIPILGRNRTP